MEREKLVKVTFKTNHKRNLDFLIKILKKALGEQNITTLSPIYMHRAQLYILDMDIRVPNALLKSGKYPSSNNKEEGEG